VIEQRRQRAEKRAYKERQAGPVSARSRHRRQNIAKGGLRSFEAATRAAGVRKKRAFARGLANGSKRPESTYSLSVLYGRPAQEPPFAYGVMIGSNIAAGGLSPARTRPEGGAPKTHWENGPG